MIRAALLALLLSGCGTFHVERGLTFDVDEETEIRIKGKHGGAVFYIKKRFQ